MNESIFLNYGYLMFPVKLKLVPEIEINNKIFFCKNNYHVSLMRLCDLSESQQKSVLKFSQTFIKQNPIKLDKITDNFRMASEGELKSIIVSVKMTGLKRLISSVNKQFGLNIVYPPTHITLFTLKDQFGIGIDTTTRYRLLTQDIDPRDTGKLLNSFR